MRGKSSTTPSSPTTGTRLARPLLPVQLKEKHMSTPPSFSVCYNLALKAENEGNRIAELHLLHCCLKIAASPGSDATHRMLGSVHFRLAQLEKEAD